MASLLMVVFMYITEDLPLQPQTNTDTMMPRASNALEEPLKVVHMVHLKAFQTSLTYPQAFFAVS